MNTSKVLAAEFVVSLGVNSWGAFKQKDAPWPATVILSGVAFGVLGIVALAAPELATTLGGGFLLASLLKLAGAQPLGNSHWTNAFGAVPPKDPPFTVITF